METLPFDSREKAEDYLRSRGFEFMGAPNRWRKVEGNTVYYAEVTSSAGQAAGDLKSLKNPPGSEALSRWPEKGFFHHQAA
jgi:hypothetical protein